MSVATPDAAGSTSAFQLGGAREHDVHPESLETQLATASNLLAEMASRIPAVQCSRVMLCPFQETSRNYVSNDI